MNRNGSSMKGFLFPSIVLFLLLTCISFSAMAQQKYNIQIDNINRTVYKNFLGIPKTVDFTLSWRVLEMQDGKYVDTDLKQLQNYEVMYAAGDSTFAHANTIKIGQLDSCKIEGLQVGKKYFFRVQAVDENNKIYQSQVAWQQPGRRVNFSSTIDEDEQSSWLWYLPVSGRFPLTLLGYGKVFDKSTFLGKAAFHGIWWFFLFGLLTIFYNFYHLNLSRIFPFTPWKLKSIITPLNYEAQFQQRKDSKFFGEGGIIARWQEVIESVEKLFEKTPRMEGDKSIDIDKLRIESATFWRDIGQKKIKELEKDIQEFEKYPTGRIIGAGLSNHETNGFKFMEASEEVDRAIENRALMELEQLKGKTKIEWLWNLSATAPLIGLFGTVTGISMAFQRLAVQSERGLVDTAAKISELAGGINEALWTTIFGLSVGIILVLFYYLFKNKLDWIYSKWEQIYVEVSEKL